MNAPWQPVQAERSRSTFELRSDGLEDAGAAKERGFLNTAGRYLLALKSGGALSNSPALLVFDFGTKQWRTLAERQINEPVWSHDGRYIYFDVVQSQADDAI